MGRIRAGWELTKKSWGILREHRELIRFPIYGAVATIPLAIITLGPGVYLIEDQGPAGAIIGRFLDVGWALITFLAVPVIAIEGTGPIETLKRSGSLFKGRWGQQITGNVAIGGAVLLLGVLPAAALIGL